MCSFKFLERQGLIFWEKKGRRHRDADKDVQELSSTRQRTAAMECQGSMKKLRLSSSYVQHCQETDRHAAVTNVCPDNQRFHLTWCGKRGVVQNIRFDSFIDDLSSVDNKGLSYQDCEVLVRITSRVLTLQVMCTSATRIYLDVRAGDQSIMFGYASDETEDAMPHTLHGNPLEKQIDRPRLE